MEENKTRPQRAEEYFVDGYNCAQAVVLAYADKMGIDEKSAIMIAGPFGGGMGRMREVCGAVSGMFMVFGACKGTNDPKDAEGKKAMYKAVRDMADEFKEQNGSIVCRELLGLTGPDGTEPEARSEKYYQKRPCAELVRIAAEIAEKYID